MFVFFCLVGGKKTPKQNHQIPLYEPSLLVTSTLQAQAIRLAIIMRGKRSLLLVGIPALISMNYESGNEASFHIC